MKRSCIVRKFQHANSTGCCEKVKNLFYTRVVKVNYFCNHHLAKVYFVKSSFTLTPIFSLLVFICDIINSLHIQNSECSLLIVCQLLSEDMPPPPETLPTRPTPLPSTLTALLGGANSCILITETQNRPFMRKEKL